MPATLKTTVTELPESRVRVQVEVAPAEIQSRLESKARQLGREMKLPGFRRGKVPAPLVIQRVGREAVLEEAVRDTLGDWYADAIDAAGIVTIGDPKLDLAELPEQGGALRFSIEIGVLPRATLGQYKGLEVARREALVDEQEVSREIDGLRERLARLETVDREAAAGDFVVTDYSGSIGGVPFEGGEGRDQLIELGSGKLIPGFEEGLIGIAAGEKRSIEVSFPSDYDSEQLAGAEASFAVTAKEIKQKLLPEVDEDFAVDVGFDSLDELREDIRGRLGEAVGARVDAEFREAALDAATANAQVQTPEALVQAKAREMWEGMLHSLSHRGITREDYMKISGRDEADLLAELQPQAEQSLRREAVLAAVVQAEQIVPSEQELLDAIAPTAEREGMQPQAVLDQLQDNGRLADLTDDLAARQAVELIVAEAKPISTDRGSIPHSGHAAGSPIGQHAQAREQLWTPESEQRARAGSGEGASGSDSPAARLWAPGR